MVVRIFIFDEEQNVQIRPNPVSQGFFHLDYYSNWSDLTLQATIYSVDGQLQKSMQLQAEKGLNPFKVDVSELGEGFYILRLIRADGKTQNFRFVILN